MLYWTNWLGLTAFFALCIIDCIQPTVRGNYFYVINLLHNDLKTNLFEKFEENNSLSLALQKRNLCFLLFQVFLENQSLKDHNLIRIQGSFEFVKSLFWSVKSCRRPDNNIAVMC